MSESITERGWFSYRYAVPGFIFILLIFLTNLDTIIYILIKSPGTVDLSAFVAILAFLSGPAVGFVVTQIWYLPFQTEIKGRSIRRRFYRNDVKQILEKTQGVRSDRFIVDADYWALEEIREPQLFDYLTRRWDLFHVLASTASTTLFGVVIGYLVRNLLPLKELFTGSCSSQLDRALIGTLNNYMNGNPSWYNGVHFWIILATVFSMVFLVPAAFHIRKENQDMIVRILEVRCAYCDHLMRATSSVCPNCGARRT
jgi:hypothetical protein